MREFSFDGLVGPTHHHAGHSHGNLASMAHANEPSDPRAAAREGLAKMRAVAALGVGQAVLPPHERPFLPALRRLGFSGDDARVLRAAAEQAPWILASVSSASSMWAANAATVTPACDAADGVTHFTPANLSSMFHRSLEVETTTRILGRIFEDPAHFRVHSALPPHALFADEGAANHTRLTTSRGSLHLFAWGRSAEAESAPARFPARQAREASAAVARLHGLRDENALLWQQDPTGIDQGAFHTDVLAVGNESLLLAHERAFVDAEGLAQELALRLGEELRVILIREHELSVVRAVAAYPFNSQLLTLPDGSMALLAPRESQESPDVRACLERLLEGDHPLARIVYVDVNASMKNGGGPACLRLRVPLEEEALRAVRARVFFDAELDRELAAWIERHYRDRLTLSDLRDPALLDESLRALDELTTLLELGSDLYDFQRT